MFNFNIRNSDVNENCELNRSFSEDDILMAIKFASYSILFLNRGLYLVVGLRALFALFIKIKGMPIIQISTEELMF